MSATRAVSHHNGAEGFRVQRVEPGRFMVRLLRETLFNATRAVSLHNCAGALRAQSLE